MHELTLRLFLINVNVLGNQNFIEPIVCHLQHKAPIYHTVTGFEPSMDDVMIMQVLHCLVTDGGTCVNDKKLIKLEMK